MSNESVSYHQPMGASPGWYPDPSGSGQQRYWDGMTWSDVAVGATPTGVPAADRRFTIHYGFALLALFSLAGTLLFGIPMIIEGYSNTHVDESGQAVAGYGAAFGVLWLLWGGMWTVIWSAFAIQHTLRGRR